MTEKVLAGSFKKKHLKNSGCALIGTWALIRTNSVVMGFSVREATAPNLI